MNREPELATRKVDSEVALPIPPRKSVTPKLPPKPIIARK